MARAAVKPRQSSPPPLETRMMEAAGFSLRVGVRPGSGKRPPLLMFNGIGANLELARPFLEAFADVEAIIFDVPGTGGSPVASMPYRPSSLAAAAAGILDQLGHEAADVTGVSWGGGLAQEFAWQHGARCRKLVLAATSPGAIMVPGLPGVLMKMASPRRYTDKGYMRSIAADIYGGDFKRDPQLINEHAENMKPASQTGYAMQLLAMAGWTSLPWAWMLKQPTLVLMGSDDPLVPVINGRMLAAMIPNARLEIIEDGGHLFAVTRPVETAARIEAFLSEG